MLQRQRNAGSSEPSSTYETLALAWVPLDIDLSLHAVPAMSLFLDFFLFQRSYSRSDTNHKAPLFAIIFAVWYGWWVERCASFNGVCMWAVCMIRDFSTNYLTVPYPFLTDNPFEIRVAIYIGATSIALVSLWVLNGAHKTLFRP
jgi:hypothetical protein